MSIYLIGYITPIPPPTQLTIILHVGGGHSDNYNSGDGSGGGHGGFSNGNNGLNESDQDQVVDK